ncbi:MAG TPA: ribosome maturation factor RimP [Acidimicrobiales bacterium]|jgi:ribosome maturation factor RimP|nr:ribosome maturation factor RimP [Acidimicrobiales bacterium]
MDDLNDALSPLLASIGLDLVDLEVTAGVVRVTVDRDGGIDLEALAAANRAVSGALDQLDPIAGRYTLEVSSPGVERKLRTPAHFARAVGETVSVRTLPGTTEARRQQGLLASVDDTGLVLSTPEGPVRIGYDQIERARTVFEWGAQPPPGKGPKGPAKGSDPKGRAKGTEKTERVTTP